jgi:dihydropyrimidinase
MHDIVIKNGTVVTATDMFSADVGVDGDKIAAIAADLSGRTVIDAGGKLVIPGGVDSHCHVEQTMMDGRVQNADDFFTGTRSAGCGGTTTIICFIIQPKDGTFADIVPRYMKSAKRAAVDYSFHLQVTNGTAVVLKEELPRLIADGHRSIKMFMCGHNFIDDLSIMRVLSVAREQGAFVTIHAESYPIHQYMAERLAAGGLRHPKYHAVLKPAIGEREAVHRIASYSELLDTPIQIFHVSAPEAAAEIEAAQKRGARVYGETCSQYFVLSAKDINRSGFASSKFVFGPAPRESANVGSLWDFFKRGVLNVVTSDHSPLNYDDTRGKKANGDDPTPELIPNGIPCVESRMSILFSEGVVKGRIDAPTFVGLTSTNAAKMFGLYPKKGTIAIGSDADIAIWNSGLTYTVRNAELNHAVDYTPFEGMQLTGKAVTTLLRGQVIWDNGKYFGSEGQGRWQPRKPYDWVRPTGHFPSGYDPFLQRVTHPDLQ